MNIQKKKKKKTANGNCTQPLQSHFTYTTSRQHSNSQNCGKHQHLLLFVFTSVPLCLSAHQPARLLLYQLSYIRYMAISTLSPVGSVFVNTVH